ncbi:MAG TPA: cell division protein FtsA [Gammaproteobacteria bacterium]|jgi:cell division protein FtsA|nr:cell division protein FtsA [Gammaproteobacteria bacterium]
MAVGNDFIASIDIGTDKIVVLVAEREDDRLRIIGQGMCPSAGVKKGSVEAIEPLSRAISKAVQQAHKSSAVDLATVRVNLSDSHLSCFEGYGKVPIADIVSSIDVNKVLDSAQAYTMPTNKEKLHVFKKKFTINGSVKVDNPVEMDADVLESNVHIVTVSSSSMRNIEYALKQCDLNVELLVLDSMASSEAILTQEEKDNGVCLIDIGAGMTNFSVFHHGGVIHSGIVAIAGNHVTEEIAFAFGTSFNEAQRLKEVYGCARTSLISNDDFVEFTQTSNRDPHQLSSHTLAEVIEEAYLDIFSLLKNNLQHEGIDKNLKSGIVLCGGGSRISGCEEFVRRFMSKRVKLSSIKRHNFTAPESIFDDYRYASAIGLLMYKEDVPQEVLVKAKGSAFGKIKDKIFGEF